MGTVYDTRTFLHDASYPSMTEMDHDHDQSGDNDGTDRFGETDVSELANYHPAPPSLLPPDRTSLVDSEEGRSILLPDTSRLDLPVSPQSALPTLAPELAKANAEHAASAAASLGHGLAPALAPTTLASSTAAMTSIVDMRTTKPIIASRAKSTPAAAARLKLIPKPDRDVTRGPGGKFYCAVEGCTEVTDGFKRRCEWNKHMDKHERPYRCEHDSCEKLPGFTYSGGLLRHEREVHGKHGGPKKTLNCPYQNCKRYSGKGFSRQENLNEHLRRVHTEATSPPEDNQPLTSDNDSERGLKRKRSPRDSTDRGDVDLDLLEEVKRLRQENQELRETLQQQRETQITMVAQIADLQGALQLNGANLSTSA